ncbi:hypothetical protein JADG_003972 [Aureobasidium aubasidani]|nr:hypothetical protein JADG_003972 [Aureobasidium pullulans]
MDFSADDKDHHHDTHAIPPKFIQEQYWHYNKVKISDLENDESVVDWNKGLSEEQAKVLKPVSTISKSAIENACITFRNAALGTEGDESPLETEIEDVTVYEHADFPGLQIAPGILPPETQVLWISQIMHQYMANPKHKINLQTDFDIEYPVFEDSGETEAPTPSLFTYDPQSTHSTPKNPETQKPLNMAQMLSRKLRWLTLGEQYHWPTRSYPRNGPTTFPSDLSTLVSGLFPHIRPESGVCLLYGQKDYMPVHRDVSELCERALASFSFGCDGIFVIARGEGELEEGEDPKKRTVAIRVRSGDCVHLDNETSLCLDNGYCFNQGNKYGSRISRGGCTDRSWNSDACPQYCQTTISDGGISISLVSESENDSKFCCGVGYDSSSQLCLANSTSNSFRPFSIDIGVAILNRTSGATTLGNTTSEVTTGNTTTAAASPSSQGPHVNIGIAIGAGAGAAVGILLVSAAIIFLCRFRKRQTHQSFQKFDSKNSYPPTPQKYIEHVELEHSPRQFQGLGIQELEGHR